MTTLSMGWIDEFQGESATTPRNHYSFQCSYFLMKQTNGSLIEHFVKACI